MSGSLSRSFRGIRCASSAAGKPAGGRQLDNRCAVFQIGLITTVFFATLFAREVVAGRLALEDLVARRLPAGFGVPAEGGVEMTLVQLASHTSGIPHHQPPGLHRRALLHVHPDGPWRDADPGRFETYVREDLERNPVSGTAYLYANVGMSLLGLIVPQRCGAPYENLRQERICRPFGMRASTARLAHVREQVVPGLEVNGTPFPNQHMAALAPSGGICSSAEDPARFARVQIERADPAVVLTRKRLFTVGEGEQVALGRHIYDRVQERQLLGATPRSVGAPHRRPPTRRRNTPGSCFRT